MFWEEVTNNKSYQLLQKQLLDRFYLADRKFTVGLYLYFKIYIFRDAAGTFPGEEIRFFSVKLFLIHNSQVSIG